MKKLTTLLITFFSINFVFAQTVTWSPIKVEAKERNIFTALFFPGIINNQYLVKEYDGGGVSFSRKVKSYMMNIDVSKLTLTKEVYLNEVAGGKSEDKQYLSFGSFIHHDKSYSFFANRNDKGVYNLLSYIQDGNGNIIQPASPFIKVDVGNLNTGNKFNDLLLPSSCSYLKPSFDKKSIIGAYISEAKNKDYSMITIAEYNDELKSTVSNSYKIPFKAFQSTQKTIFGPMPTGDTYPPSILDIMKDNNGFYYVMLYSANPDNQHDLNTNWVCQFKLSDPAYQKLYRKEIIRDISPVEMQLFQNSTGSVYVSNIGRAIENGKNADDKYHVNSVFIGTFAADGQLETLVSQKLSNEMMYRFEKQKTVDKKGYVDALSVKNILSTSDGGFYVIWQHQTLELLPKDYNYKNNNNVLVQYYTKSKKLSWEKLLYKKQKIKDVNYEYIGLKSILVNDELFLFYPDHKKNADLPVENPEVEELNLAFFSPKSATGFFTAVFTKSGGFNRKYIHLPEDKIGSVLLLNSIIHLENKEFIGTIRKMDKGLMGVKADAYTFFKIKL